MKVNSYRIALDGRLTLYTYKANTPEAAVAKFKRMLGPGSNTQGIDAHKCNECSNPADLAKDATPFPGTRWLCSEHSTVAFND